ncbi:alpha/beta hydrolase [Akkermansiaceae bacterium]|nr:alpha/beta hydrolase [Akkermansiaceae bacterium]MDA8975429.1 alpha/beta hydrolase [Akkermansiaceae bacterium]MDB4272807.1 alpha/beta hydrolase [Akkermansiaceae bacterium]MDB4332075.1 alpha/beta hydrolase [Akkermansiaceae bacterium]MDB4525544.1 alpha/beta hydrolase [Akkermansiaceae bacterium]
MKKLRMLIPPLPGEQARHRPAVGDRVILLHGLWRSVWAMEHLAELIHEQGFETLSVPYASFRKPMDEIVDDVARVVQSYDDGKPVHYVTHSMGGIVVRHLGHRFPELVKDRAILLAPPNQGSEIVDWLEDFPLSHWAFGPGGMSLSTKAVSQEVPGFSGEVEVAVVMGKSNSMPFFQSLLGEENDGIVSVKGGEVDGMNSLRVLEGDHTFIMAESAVGQEVISFLQGEESGVDS